MTAAIENVFRELNNLLLLKNNFEPTRSELYNVNTN